MARRSSVGGVDRSALAVLVATFLTTSCGSGGRTLPEPVDSAGAVPVTRVTPEPSETVSADPRGDRPTTADSTSPVPPLVSEAARVIVIDRLSSPANAIAEIEGAGAIPTDRLTVDGDLADVVSFDRRDDGTFLARVRIDEEGAHTVCVAEECGRVYTRAPGAESLEEVSAKIDQALVDAAAYLDVAGEFPDWTIEVGGTFSGTAGSTDVDARTIRIYRNRGRTVDEFVRTILHEFGHAADHDRLTDEERMEYLVIRGLDPASSWTDGNGHRVDDWARRPNEDFAEVMVSIWSDGRWTPRTDGVGPAPDAGQLAEIAELAAD